MITKLRPSSLKTHCSETQVDLGAFRILSNRQKRCSKPERGNNSTLKLAIISTSCDIDVSGAGAPEGADARARGEEQLEHGASSDQKEAGGASKSEGTYSIYSLKISVADPNPEPEP